MNAIAIVLILAFTALKMIFIPSEASESKGPMIAMEFSSQRVMRTKISVQLIVSSLCAIWPLQDAVVAVGLVEQLEHQELKKLNVFILLLKEVIPRIKTHIILEM